jgi:hypothetical protein
LCAIGVRRLEPTVDDRSPGGVLRCGLLRIVCGSGVGMPKLPMPRKTPDLICEFSTIGAFDRASLNASGSFMSKTRKSARELAELIRMQIGVGELAIGVRKDHAFGWQPMIEYAPGNALGFQRRADEIAEKLRQQYDLAE